MSQEGGGKGGTVPPSGAQSGISTGANAGSLIDAGGAEGVPPQDSKKGSTSSAERRTKQRESGPGEEIEGEVVKRHGNGLFFSVMLVLKDIVGAGIINFPFAYKKVGGIFIGTFVQSIVAALATPPLIIIAMVSDKIKKDTIHEAAEYCGPKWALFNTIVTLLKCYFQCVLILTVIGNLTDQLWTIMYGPGFCNYWYMRKQLAVPVLCLIFISPYIFMRRILFIDYNSAVGVAGMSYLVLLVVAEFIMYRTDSSHKEPALKWKPDRALDVVIVLPTFITAFQCHITTVPTYSCMKERTIRKWTVVVLLAMGLAAIMTPAVGIFGYATFGEATDQNIVMSYDVKRPEVIIGIVAVLLAQLMTYPMYLFCGRQSLITLYLRIRKKLTGKPDELTDREQLIYRIVFSLIWYIGSLVSVFIPGVLFILERVGILSCFFIFFFPGVFLLYLIRNQYEKPYTGKTKFLYFTGIFYVTFGVCLIVWLAILTTYNDIIRPPHDKPCPPDIRNTTY